MTDTLEMIYLENLLNTTPRCESLHQHTTCSEQVTHRYVTCKFSKNVCLNVAVYVRAFREQHRHCKCGRFSADCWRLIPI